MDKCPKCGKRLLSDGTCYCEFTPSSNTTKKSKTVRLVLRLIIIAAFVIAFGLNFILISDTSQFPDIFVGLIGLIAAIPGLYLCTASDDSIDSWYDSLENGTGCLTILLFGILPFIILRFLKKSIPRPFIRAYGVVLVMAGIIILFLPTLIYKSYF